MKEGYLFWQRIKFVINKWNMNEIGDIFLATPNFCDPQHILPQ